MELLDLGVVTLRAICNAYHVDSSLFNDPANKTFNNRKEAQKALWTDAILPEIYKTDQALNQWLTPQISKFENRNLKLCPELDNIEPLQQDMELLSDRLVKLRMSGIISGNDARKMIGLDPVEDEAMDSVYISMNQVDITENDNVTEDTN
jgi:phage portal protein BeeE